MMIEMGYCPGIENYSAPLSWQAPGEPPEHAVRLLPRGLSCCSSTRATPRSRQVGAMYNGDRSRKTTLVEHGFRLPSALDNRPLKFEEWKERIKQCVYVSATPADYELEQCGGEVVEQVVRPTGLLDPVIELSPARGPGAAPAGADQGARRRGRAGPRDDAHQTARRGPVELPHRARACSASGSTPNSTPSSGSSCCATCGRASSSAWWA